jgi:hypothetical protein
MFCFLIIHCPFWLLAADSRLKTHVALAFFGYHVLVHACARCFLLLQFYNFGSLLMPHSLSLIISSGVVLLPYFLKKISLIPHKWFHLVLGLLYI